MSRRRSLGRIAGVDRRWLLERDALPRRAPSGDVDWSAVFGRDAPLRVEVGVGNSPFLLDVARLEPEASYLGLETAWKRVLKFLGKVNASGLENIRMIGERAEEMFRSVLAAESVDHVFVNFPDPWPKKRHAKNRFVQADTAARVRDALRPGGRLSLRTDALDYAQEMLDVLDATTGLENLAGRGEFAERPIYPFPTQFELRWIAEGRPIRCLEYRRES